MREGCAFIIFVVLLSWLLSSAGSGDGIRLKWIYDGQPHTLVLGHK